MSPNQRAWERFKRNRVGHVSLWVFMALLVVATTALGAISWWHGAELAFTRVVALLDAMEPLLIEIANAPETMTPGEFWSLVGEKWLVEARAGEAGS